MRLARWLCVTRSHRLLWSGSYTGSISRDESPELLSMFTDERLEGRRNDDAWSLWVGDDLATLGEHSGEHFARGHSLRSTTTEAGSNDGESAFPADFPVIPLLGKKLSGFGSPEGSGMGSPKWRSAGTP